MREVLYPWHPWFGLQVAIHEVIAKAGREVFRCGCSGKPVGRWLEIPAWMFDRGACAWADLTAAPRVDIAALTALLAVLRGAVTCGGPLNVSFSEASRNSHDQNWGEIHATPQQAASRCSPRAVPDRPVHDNLSIESRRGAGVGRSSKGDEASADPPVDAPHSKAHRQRPGSRNYLWAQIGSH